MRLLWRRRVVLVAVAYAAVAAVLAPAAIFLERMLGLPGWTDEAVLAGLVVLFIPAVWLAWTSGAAPDQGAPTSPRRAGAVIAVLPFVNFSQAPVDEAFADGMVEDLITGLAMSSTLKVISRSSTFAYKGQSPDVREVASDLGCDFVLEGSVRRAGERLRVTVQLVEAVHGSHVWAEKYDRPVAELFELQDDLICEIAAALGDAVMRAELQRLRRSPANVSAWEESMHALTAQERPTLPTVKAALAHVRRAVELDRNFALGHARLGMTLVTYAQLVGGEAAKPLRDEAEDALDKSIDLAPNDPKVLGIVCGALAYLGRTDEAIRHGLRARTLNPHDAPTLGALANAYFRAGRYAEAAPLYAEEQRLSPRSPILGGRSVFHALNHVMLGDLIKAEAVLLRGLEVDSAFEGAWIGLILVRLMRGDTPGAADAIRGLRRVNAAATLDDWTRLIEANMPAARAPEAVAAFRQAWTAVKGD